jgi:amino acid permease
VYEASDRDSSEQDGQHMTTNGTVRRNISTTSSGGIDEVEKNNDGAIHGTDGGSVNITDTDDIRTGTISSARFNILSTMVGGGCLSLPLAFQKSGLLVGPMILVITAGITEFIFRTHVESSRIYGRSNNNNNNSNNTTKGVDTFEGIAGIAFGKCMVQFCKLLVTLMCFFGTVGYAVLLRDMLKPVNDYFFLPLSSSSTVVVSHSSLQWRDNVSMWIVVLLLTPACTLRTLTSLQRFGALGMFAVFVLGCCIFYRSSECIVSMITTGGDNNDIYGYNDISTNNITTSMITMTRWQNFRLFPATSRDVLDVLPLYISCYVCHYNLLPVHNELCDPTEQRVRSWLRTTVWGSTMFYCLLGLSGSIYGICSASSSSSNDNNNYNNTTSITIHGNILLDFPEHDPLLLVGRMCLAITIALAFPMLTIPSRDILIQSLPDRFCCCSIHRWWRQRRQQRRRRGGGNADTAANAMLTEALLQSNGGAANDDVDDDDDDANDNGDGIVVLSVHDLSTSNDSYLFDTVEGAAVRSQHSRNDEEGTNFVAAATTTAVETAKVASALYLVRLSTTIVMFWSAVAVASYVTSIDIVWDLLGSSLSILLSYLIPASCYIALCHQQPAQQQQRHCNNRVSVVVSYIILFIFTPMMFVSTANAVYNTFYKEQKL